MGAAAREKKSMCFGFSCLARDTEVASGPWRAQAAGSTAGLPSGHSEDVQGDLTVQAPEQPMWGFDDGLADLLRTMPH